MKAKTEKFTINLEINGRKIVLTNVVWNNKTGHYDISITTNQAIPPYTEQA